MVYPSNGTAFIKIETVPLPVKEREFLRPTPSSVKTGNLKDQKKIDAKIQNAILDWKHGEGCYQDSLQSKIALIGIILFQGEESKEEITIKHKEEDEILIDFWEVMTKHEPLRVVGDNIRAEASQIIHRSLIHEVPFPVMWRNDLFQYLPKRWVDITYFWSLGDRKAKSRSLKHLCKAFNIPLDETPLTGHEFRVWWKSNKKQCVEYNMKHLRAMLELYERISIS